MNNTDNTSIVIKYKQNNEAREKLMRFILDYYIEKAIYRKVDENEYSSETKK